MSPVLLEHGFASYIIPHVLFHVADVFSLSLQCRNSEKQAANEKVCPNFGPTGAVRARLPNEGSNKQDVQQLEHQDTDGQILNFTQRK